MALPTLTRSWTTRTNVAIPAAASYAESNHRWAWEWKRSMVTLGAVVLGSSDATSAGMDSTDRWADWTKVLHGAGAHSWVVLRFAGIGAKFEICWDLLGVNGGDYTGSLLYVSPVNGFGAANGGTDGSVTSRPTATDEVRIFATGDWSLFGSNVILNAHRADFWVDATGSFFYWARLYNSDCIVFGFLGVPNNPPAEWTSSPKWVVGSYGGGGAANRGNWYNNARVFSQVNGTPAGTSVQALASFLTQETFNGAPISSVQTFSADLNAGWCMLPVGIYDTNIYRRGRLGDMPDIWWGAETNVLTGDTYPADGSNQFIQLNQLILPWDGSTPVVTG